MVDIAVTRELTTSALQSNASPRGPSSTSIDEGAPRDSGLSTALLPLAAAAKSLLATTPIARRFITIRPFHLRLVRKTAAGMKPLEVDEVAQDDAWKLRKWYSSVKPESHVAANVQALLANATQKECRYACNCRDDTEINPALLTPYEVETGAGVYTVRRLVTRAEHAWYCCFHDERPVATNDSAFDDAVQAKGEPDLLRGHGRPRDSAKRAAHGKSVNQISAGGCSATVSAHGALMHIVVAAGRTR
jgi:hypothetical protein